MNTVEASGKTREDAVRKALRESGVAPQSVLRIETLDEGSRGIFGRGRRDVRVRITWGDRAGAGGQNARSAHARTRGSLQDTTTPNAPQRPVRNRSNVFLLVGAGAAVLGIGIFAKLSAYPIAQWRAAQEWVETPCVIVTSEETKGEESSTVRIDYQYTWNDDTYSGHLTERTSFLYLYAPEYVQKLLADHPADHTSVCYVNPNRPEKSLLTRQFSPGYLTGLWGLFVLWTGWMVFERGRRERTTQEGGIPELESIEPKTTGWWIGELGGAAFGNALAVLFGVGIYKLSQLPDCSPAVLWVSTILLILFWGAPVIVLDIRLFRKMLAARNPRLVLHLTPESVALGGSSELDWTLTGAVGRIRRFRIWLEGRDEAERGGEETRWETVEVFKTIPIFETAQASAMRQGLACAKMPASTHCTSGDGHRRVRWLLRVHGEIARWPDVDEYFPVTVFPAHSEGAGRE